MRRFKDPKVEKGEPITTHNVEEHGQVKVHGFHKKATYKTEILSIGTKLIKTVDDLNASLAGMIINTYFSCLIITTVTLYSSSTILFTREPKVLILFSAASFSIAVLMISRLIWLTESGHNLSISMRKCAHHLDRLKLMENDENEIQLLKQDMRYHCESPLNPVSAFGVSTSTMLGAYGTIVTYLIVLLQFKVGEKPSDVSQEKNGTNITNSTSNLTSNN